MVAAFFRKRAAAPLLCLALAACAGGTVPGMPGDQPGPVAAVPTPPPPPASVSSTSSPSRPAPSMSGGGGARAASTARNVAQPNPDAPNPGADPLTQARADCWMAVEGQRALKGIDQRIAYVDKCVNDRMKNQ